MAAFVDDQIDEIQEEKSGAVGEGVEKEQGVEAEPGDSREAGDGFPGAEFSSRRVTCSSVARPVAERRRLSVISYQ